MHVVTNSPYTESVYYVSYKHAGDFLHQSSIVSQGRGYFRSMTRTPTNFPLRSVCIAIEKRPISVQKSLWKLAILVFQGRMQEFGEGGVRHE